MHAADPWHRHDGADRDAAKRLGEQWTIPYIHRFLSGRWQSLGVGGEGLCNLVYVGDQGCQRQVGAQMIASVSLSIFGFGRFAWPKTIPALGTGIVKRASSGDEAMLTAFLQPLGCASIRPWKRGPRYIPRRMAPCGKGCTQVCVLFVSATSA